MGKKGLTLMQTITWMRKLSMTSHLSTNIVSRSSRKWSSIRRRQTRSHQPYHNWCALDFLERQKFYKKSRDFQCLYWGLTPQHLLPPWESGLIKEHRVILPSLFCLAFWFWYNRFLVYIVWRLWLPWSVMQASFVAVERSVRVKNVVTIVVVAITCGR